MTELLVTCCTKSGTDCQSITHLGGPNNGGAQWVWTKEIIIGHIERGAHQFYTFKPNTKEKAYVEVVTERTGKYLRTRANSTSTDNLLSLNSCPR